MSMPEKRIVPDLEHYIKVGDLRKLLDGVPDDVPVYYERIEDWYMEPGKGWVEHCVQVKDGTQTGPFFFHQYHQAWGAWYDREHKAIFITAFY